MELDLDAISAAKQADLDQLLLDFTCLQQYINHLKKDSESTENKVSTVTQELARSRKGEEDASQALKEMSSLLRDLQDTLNKRCDVEAENMDLKSSIGELESLLETEKRSYTMSHDALKNDIVILKEEHRKSLENQKSLMESEASIQRDCLDERMQDKSNTIDALQQQLSNLEKEKQSELVKLRLEYEEKIMRLQKQNTRVQQTQVCATNQDIFRKKLQHAKAESDKEISALKRKISELQQKLESQQHRPAYNSLSISKKRKL